MANDPDTLVWPMGSDSIEHYGYVIADPFAALRDVHVPAVRKWVSEQTAHVGEALAEHDVQFRRNVERCRAIEGLDLDLERALSI